MLLSKASCEVLQVSKRNKPVLVRFPVNTVGRDFICSDPHGMFELLMAKLREVKFDKKKDRLFCAGDLIDRGPDSLKCLELIYENWFFTTRGNHDQFLVEYYRRKGSDKKRFWDFWFKNGGSWVKSEDQGYLKAIAKDVDAEVPYKILIGDSVGIVHADVLGDKFLTDDPVDEVGLWEMIESRSRFKGNKIGPVKDLRRLYVGHSKTKNKLVFDNVHFMDGGAFSWGDLRLEEIPKYLFE